ncbi:MAG TPA: hypothetical protein VJZ00_02735 [Thermoanaerobaculia bacterium]|nr:hypothetical protein [Thermoanaerobaculia bacterium]
MKKLIFVLLLATPLLAQVTVTQVNDRRTSGKFFAHLTLSLELAKVKSADVAASRVLVTTATDNAGNSLIDAEAQAPSLEPNSRMSDAEPTTPATVSLELKNPERKATSLKEVRGDIELYMPSKDPNSVADVAKFLSFSGKTLTHKALKANGVEIALISPAQIDAEKKRIGDVKRKEAKDAGYDDADIESVVKSYLESTLNLDEGEVLVRIKDPNKRIQSLNFVAGTEAKHVSMSEEEGFVKLSSWGDKPQPDWGLRVSMTTPKNLVKQPFTLKDVPLP